MRFQRQVAEATVLFLAVGVMQEADLPHVEFPVYEQAEVLSYTTSYTATANVIFTGVLSRSSTGR